MIVALAVHGVSLLINRQRQRLLSILAALGVLLLLCARLNSLEAFSALVSVLVLAAALIAGVLLLLRVAQQHPVEKPQPPQRHWSGIAELPLWAALTISMTYPLVSRLGSAFSDQLDSYLNSWILAWVHYQLWSAPLELFDTNILAPYPKTLAHSEHLLGLYPLSAPLLWLGLSPATVHNSLILISFMLAGWGMSLFAREVTGSRIAGMSAGILYAFFPYRLTQLAHLQQLAGLWLPFAFWALERFRRRGGWAHALLAGLFFLLQSLVSYYYAVFLAIAVLVYVLFFLIVDRDFRTPQRLLRLSAAGIAIATIHIPLLLPYLYLKQHLGFQRRPDESINHAATLVDYLTPSHTDGFYRVVAAVFDALAPYPTTIFSRWLVDWAALSQTPEGKLFPGVFPIIFAVAGLAAYRRHRVVWAMVFMLLTAIVLSFGPLLLVDRSSPPLLDVMPYSLLGLTSMIRVPARFALIQALALAVLVGCGIDSIVRWLSKRASKLAAPAGMIGLLLLLGELVRLPLVLYPIPAAPTGIDAWLSRQPAGLILHLPYAGLEGDARHEFYSTAHFHPMVNGYSGFFALPAYRGLIKDLPLIPDQQQMKLLQGLGLRYLVVHRSLVSEAKWQSVADQLQRQPAVEQLVHLPDAMVAIIAPDPWADEVAAHLGPGARLFVGDGGALPPYFAQLLALRFHEHVVAGRTLLGLRDLREATPGVPPEFALIGSDEDVSHVGYRNAETLWQNELFRLIRRVQ